MAKQAVRILEYNAWRNSLPEHCWHCANYDKCSPNHACAWNPKCRKKRRDDD